MFVECLPIKAPIMPLKLTKKKMEASLMRFCNLFVDGEAGENASSECVNVHSLSLLSL